MRDTEIDFNCTQKRVIVVGTDPIRPRGGIGTAMGGYIDGLQSVGLLYEMVPTYQRTGKGGKWRPALKALPRIRKAIKNIRASGMGPVVYSHAGAWPSLVREVALLILSRAMGALTLIQIHAPEMDSYLCSPVGRFLVKLALSPVNMVCVLTPWWKVRLQAAGVHKPTVIIPNPLPPELERVANNKKKTIQLSSSGNARELTILTMSRLVKGKGVDMAIEALAQLPHWMRLVVAGDGPEKPYCEALVSKLGISDRVTFCGWVSGREKARLFEEADIFCLPSINDSFGMGFIEAMAYGVPVVAVHWGAIPDVVKDGLTGILIDAPEPAKVVTAIERLAKGGTLQEMSVEGKRWVLENYSASFIGNKLKGILDDHGLDVTTRPRPGKAEVV